MCWVRWMGLTLIASHLLQIGMLRKIRRVVLHKTALLSVHSHFAFFILLVGLKDQLQMQQCTCIHAGWIL